jgi:hypothetical protein
MAANTDFFENKLIDWLFRAQAIGITGATAAAGTGPATLYIGLISAAGSDASPGTELSGGGYARVAVTSSLANWAGTQAAASTTVSSGTSGTTSNNVAITFPVSTGSQGTAVEWGAFDAATAGNELIRAALTSSIAIGSAGITPSFAPGALTYQIDN